MRHFVALKRIAGGEPFADVARAMSRDATSRDKGGDLGWHLPEHFMDEFPAVMVSLEPRGLSYAPARTKHGWHSIQVLAVKPAVPPPFEEVKDRIAQQLREDALAKK